jgi:uncharacterized protein (DUF952 family)
MLSVMLTVLAAAMPLTCPQNCQQKIEQKEEAPSYLYKVLSVENWKKSQSDLTVTLSADDKDFIHFSQEDQLERITSKYWASAPEYVVLKVDTSKLSGKLVFETNPGGTSKYYHLYEGSIPLEAIAESKVVKNK